MLSSQDPHRWYSEPRVGEMSQCGGSLWGARGSSLTLSTPALGSCTGKMSHHNIWLYKSVALNSRRNEPALPKSLCTNTLILRPSTERGVWKSPKPCAKEIYWLVLWHVKKEQKIVRIFSEDGNDCRHHFPYSPSTLGLALMDGIFILPIYLTTTTHPTQMSPVDLSRPIHPFHWVWC